MLSSVVHLLRRSRIGAAAVASRLSCTSVHHECSNDDGRGGQHVARSFSTVSRMCFFRHRARGAGTNGRGWTGKRRRVVTSEAPLPNVLSDDNVWTVEGRSSAFSPFASRRHVPHVARAPIAFPPSFGMSTDERSKCPDFTVQTRPKLICQPLSNFHLSIVVTSISEMAVIIYTHTYMCVCVIYLYFVSSVSINRRTVSFKLTLTVLHRIVYCRCPRNALF